MAAIAGVALAEDQCEWFGTSPLCDGECPGGWRYVRRSNEGDGKKCWTGEKKYCCKWIQPYSDSGSSYDSYGDV